MTGDIFSVIFPYAIPYAEKALVAEYA